MKLRKRFKNAFLVCFWVLFGTGALEWIFDRWVRLPGPFGDEHHPLQPWLTRAHTLSAYLILIGFGYLWHAHINPGLKAQRRRRSGIALIAVLGVLAASSLAILYAPDGSVRVSSIFIHTYLGMGIPLFLGLHLLLKNRVINFRGLRQIGTQLRPGRKLAKLAKVAQAENR